MTGVYRNIRGTTLLLLLYTYISCVVGDGTIVQPDGEGGETGELGGTATPPTNVQAKQTGLNSVYVTWDQSTDVGTDPSSNLHFEYGVYWFHPNIGEPIFAGSVTAYQEGGGANVLEYTITGLTKGETYDFYVELGNFQTFSFGQSESVTLALDANWGSHVYTYPTTLSVEESTGVVYLEITPSKIYGKDTISCETLNITSSRDSLSLPTQTATENVDYSAPSQSIQYLTFYDTSTEPQKCNFTILSDSVAESDEVFSVLLLLSGKATNIDITIKANQKPGLSTATASGYTLTPSFSSSVTSTVYNVSTDIPYSSNQLSWVFKSQYDGSNITLGTSQGNLITSGTAITQSHAIGYSTFSVVSSALFSSLTYTFGVNRAQPSWTIASITPSVFTIHGGTVLTVTGTGFTSFDRVRFGDVNAASVAFVSSSELTVTTPAGSGPAIELKLWDPDFQYSHGIGPTLSYNAPSITALSPTSGPSTSATELTISGLNLGFRSTQSQTVVRVGSVDCPVTSITDPDPSGGGQVLKCTLPRGIAGASLTVQVLLSGLASSQTQFVYTYIGGPPGVTVSRSGGMTDENGNSFDISVVLSLEPTATVTVPISVSDVSEASASKTALTFTQANWNITQISRVRGVEDSIVDGDQVYTVTVGPGTSTDLNFNQLAADKTVWNVTNYDNDVIGVRYTALTELTHSNSTVSIGLTLGSQPSGPVAVVVSADSQFATVSTPTVNFSPSDWNVSHTTVFSFDSSTLPAPSLTRYRVTLQATSSADPQYQQANATMLDIAVVKSEGATVVPQFVVEQKTVTTNEQGSRDSVLVTLIWATTAPVSIFANSSIPSEVEVVQSTFTFPPNPGNGAVQTVSVECKGLDDFYDDGNKAGVLDIFQISTGTGTGNASTTPTLIASVPLVNEDDDVSSFIFSQIQDTNEASQPEGSITVALTVQPNAPVTFTATSISPAIGTVRPNTIETFVLENRTQEATIRVGGVKHPSSVDQFFSLRLEVAADTTDAGYQGVVSTSPRITNKHLVWPEFCGISTSVLPESGGQVMMCLRNVLAPGPNGTKLYQNNANVPLRQTGQVLLQTSDAYVNTDLEATLGGSPKGYASLVLVNPDGAFLDLSSNLVFSDSCPENGTYGYDSTCVTCPSTAECPGGGRVWPKSGAWVPAEFPSNETVPEVFECHPPERCAGGQNSTCAAGYTGDFCGTCADGYYRRDEVCRECSSAGVTISLAVINLVFVIAIVASIILVTENMLTNVMTVISFIQLVRAVGQMNIHRMPEDVQNIFQILSLSTGDYQFMRPDCADAVIPSSDFLATFWTTIAIEAAYRGLIILLIPLHAVAWNLYLRRLTVRTLEVEAEERNREALGEALDHHKNVDQSFEANQSMQSVVESALAASRASVKADLSASHPGSESIHDGGADRRRFSDSVRDIRGSPFLNGSVDLNASAQSSIAGSHDHHPLPGIGSSRMTSVHNVESDLSQSYLSHSQTESVHIDDGGASMSWADDDVSDILDDGGASDTLDDGGSDRSSSRHRSRRRSTSPRHDSVGSRRRPRPSHATPNPLKEKEFVRTSSDQQGLPAIVALVNPHPEDTDAEVDVVNISQSYISTGTPRRGLDGSMVDDDDLRKKTQSVYHGQELLHQSKTRELWQVTASRFIRGNLIISVFSFFNLATRCFQAVYCVPAYGKRYLSQEMTTECYTAEHYPAAVTGWVIIIGYCILAPQIIGMFFYRRRNQLAETHIKSKWGYLYEKYRLKTYWFGLVTLNALVIVAFATTILAREPLAQFLVIELTYGGLFLLYTVLKPFVAKWKNRVAFFVLLAVLIGGLLNFLSTQQALSEYGFGVFAVIGTVLYLVVLFGFFVKWAVQALRRRRVREEREREIDRFQMQLARQAADKWKSKVELARETAGMSAGGQGRKVRGIADLPALLRRHGQLGAGAIGWDRRGTAPARRTGSGDGRPHTPTLEDQIVGRMHFEKPNVDPTIFETPRRIPTFAETRGEHNRKVTEIHHWEDGERPPTPTREDDRNIAASFATPRSRVLAPLDMSTASVKTPPPQPRPAVGGLRKVAVPKPLLMASKNSPNGMPHHHDHDELMRIGHPPPPPTGHHFVDHHGDHPAGAAVGRKGKGASFKPPPLTSYHSDVSHLLAGPSAPAPRSAGPIAKGVSFKPPPLTSYNSDVSQLLAGDLPQRRNSGGTALPPLRVNASRVDNMLSASTGGTQDASMRKLADINSPLPATSGVRFGRQERASSLSPSALPNTHHRSQSAADAAAAATVSRRRLDASDLTSSPPSPQHTLPPVSTPPSAAPPRARVSPGSGGSRHGRRGTQEYVPSGLGRT